MVCEIITETINGKKIKFLKFCPVSKIDVETIPQDIIVKVRIHYIIKTLEYYLIPEFEYPIFGNVEENNEYWRIYNLRYQRKITKYIRLNKNPNDLYYYFKPCMINYVNVESFFTGDDLLYQEQLFDCFMKNKRIIVFNYNTRENIYQTDFTECYGCGSECEELKDKLKKDNLSLLSLDEIDKREKEIVLAEENFIKKIPKFFASSKKIKLPYTDKTEIITIDIHLHDGINYEENKDYYNNSYYTKIIEIAQKYLK